MSTRQIGRAQKGNFLSMYVCVCEWLHMQMNGETDKISIKKLLVTHRGTKSSGIQRATGEVRHQAEGLSTATDLSIRKLNFLQVIKVILSK